MYLREYQWSKVSEQELLALQEENVVAFLFSCAKPGEVIGSFWNDLLYKLQMNLMGLSAFMWKETLWEFRYFSVSTPKLLWFFIV